MSNLSFLIRSPLAIPLLALCSSHLGCAETDTDPDAPSSDNLATTDAGYRASDSGTLGTAPYPSTYDAGFRPPDATGITAGGQSAADSGMWSLGFNDPFGDGGLLGGGKKSDASTPTGDGGTDICKDAVCFDVFDCYIFHPDKGSCGFTACDGFICK